MTNKKKKLTVTLFGGSNGTATLCALLNPEDYIVRVITRSANRFLEQKQTTTYSTNTTTSSGNSAEDDDTETTPLYVPRTWQCDEQVSMTDLVPASFLPKKWNKHVATPGSVYIYRTEGDNRPIEAAVSGRSYHDIQNDPDIIEGCFGQDDGGVTDMILLACPVNAHLDILRRIARAMYALNRENALLGSNAPPILIGSLYAGGGFDWMCRIAFMKEKPLDFTGWKRPLALFGLKAFPFLTKSLKPGHVNLWGRFPELIVCASPNDSKTRTLIEGPLRKIFNRKVQWMGLSSNFGGDGSAYVSDSRLQDENGDAVHDCKKKVERTLEMSQESMADLADPYCSLGFLSSTLNSTNQYLHPCIIGSLFMDPNVTDGIGDGSIEWNGPTPTPLFYADGARAPGAIESLVDIATAEVFPLLVLLDAVLAPSNLKPISGCFGGEPVARFVLRAWRNDPYQVTDRSKIRERITSHQSCTDNSIITTKMRVNMPTLMAWMMRNTLALNARLGSVGSPAKREPKTGRLKADVTTRFFVDDVPHGLCICLGLAELLGFDLERDMANLVKLVRKLQSWMGKEYILPSKSPGKFIVADALDLKETCAPQAFGVNTIKELRDFISTSPFCDEKAPILERQVLGSSIFEKEAPPIRSRL